MTVKSPFYNKPSTSTSVDSCHKCPSIPTTTQDLHVPSTDLADRTQAQQAQYTSTTGFEQRLSETSNNASTATTTNTDTDTAIINGTTASNGVVVEPCSSSAAKSDIGTTSQTSCSNCGTTTTPLWRRSPQGKTICNACGLYLKARNTTRPPWLKRNSTKRPIPLAPVTLAPAPIAMKIPISSSSSNMVLPIAPHPAVRSTLTSPSPPSPPLVTSPSPSASSCDSVSDLDDANDYDQCSDKADGRSMTCFNCSTMTTPLWRRDGEGNTICNACGLYYKLHSVHRPITMKRPIIKRRKRVAIPATMSTLAENSPVAVGTKRKLSTDDQQQPLAKRIELPLLAAKETTKASKSTPENGVTLPNVSTIVEPIEPDAFQRHYLPHTQRHHLPSPPLHPVKSSNLASLLNPSNDHGKRLPPISLPGLPSPPMVPHDTMQPLSPPRSYSSSPPPSSSSSQASVTHSSMPTYEPASSSTVAAAAAAAFATVSALLNPNANRQHTHQMLEAHRHELQREVTNLTSMLTRTTAMLENLDQVMAVTSNATENNSSALQSILALSKSTSVSD